MQKAQIEDLKENKVLRVENGKTGKVNYEITRNAATTNDNIVLQSQLQTDIKVKSASQ